VNIVYSHYCPLFFIDMIDDANNSGPSGEVQNVWGNSCGGEARQQCRKVQGATSAVGVGVDGDLERSTMSEAST
jgi:hypothetical protein